MKHLQGVPSSYLRFGVEIRIRRPRMQTLFYPVTTVNSDIALIGSAYRRRQVYTLFLQLIITVTGKSSAVLSNEQPYYGSAGSSL